MSKSQRIRDPIHDLIEFTTSDLDQLLWKLISQPEFQRLRRVKQLGFSEFVYPGATHSRFAHSIGVFHTARELVQIIHTRPNVEIDKEKEQVALIAALLHDLGHGPFSHAFEEAVKQLNKDEAKRNGNSAPNLKKHELWTRDIVLESEGVGRVLEDFDKDIQKSVADLLVDETPRDIYAATVSSQFDADRLDYMRRDRFMTGVQHGGFDLSWLLANLEVGKIHLSIDDEEFDEVDSLVLNEKCLQAAEAYVLGLFQLYFSVYFHKATRSAEVMLTAVLRRIGDLCADNNIDKTGLQKGNPIIKFLQDRSLENYLRLDDTIVWSSLSEMTDAKDDIISELSERILKRNLYKSRGCPR